MTIDQRSDRQAITAVVNAFLSSFVSGPEAAQRAEHLHELLLPTATIIRTCGIEPAIYTVDSFIQPRVELLTSGRLHDFREWLVDCQIDVFGDVAQAWCWYSKSWTEKGNTHLEHGMKTVQLVRTASGWRISALAWDDERPGLAVPAVRPQSTLAQR